MPAMSKDTTQAREHGPGTEWQGELDGYAASFVSITADADLTPLLAGLPGDQCPSPHWGYVLKGRIWWRYDDHEEVIEAGQAFYAPPGHTSGAYAGAEFLVFSPSEVMARVQAHMMSRARELDAATRG